MKQEKHDIFISFSFKDQAIAEKVAEQLLNKYHITYWMCTQELRGGDHFKSAIVDAIGDAKVVLMIQSGNSIASREVPKEIAVSLEKHKTVVPFVIDDAELNGDLEYDLIGIHHVDARKPTLDERIAELALQIYALMKKSTDDADDEWLNRLKKETRLMSTAQVLPKKVFCGRDSVLDEIASNFKNGEHIQFLYGIGGIGKTQIAKQYVKKYKEDYDTIVFATYNGSLREMIVSDTPFALEPEMRRYTMADGTEESDKEFFVRKLEKIKKITDERTIVVIDNFDTDYDEDLEKLVGGNYHLLITTRFDYSKHYPSVKIDSISSIESLKDIFMQNYGGYDVSETDPELEELIELVNRHTYTIELLAQHMENSGQTASEMIEELKREGVASLQEQVRSEDMQKNTAFENLVKMFRLFTLSEEEKKILMYLSFMPIDGINVRTFREWAQLDSCRLIKELENKSWLIKNMEGIALHPVIRDVIRHEIPVTYENCGDFFRRFTDAIEDKKMWSARQVVKNRYAQIGRNVADKFSQIDNTTEDFYYFLQSLLSFNVDEKAAEKLADSLYNYNLSTYGDSHFKTGRAAFKRGWIYTRGVWPDETIDKAIEWLKKADSIFNQAEMTTTDETSRHTMTKRCLAKMYLAKYRITGDKEMYQLAKEYTEDSIKHSLVYFKPGDYHYAKIGGDYMQLSEVLMAGKEFDGALDSVDKAIDILIGHYGTEDNSDMGLAYYIKANILYAMGSTAESIALAKRSAELYEDYFGKTEPKLYELYLMIGDCYAADNDSINANEHYSRALKTAEMVFPPNSEKINNLREKMTLNKI